jgi:integrase
LPLVTKAGRMARQLKVRHFDEVRRRLLITDNAVQLGVDHVVGSPKDDEPREVPVPKLVMEELKRQLRGRGPDGLVFGDGVNYLPRPKSNGGWFAGAVKRAKIQRITPHDLRHTAASLAISAGANVLAVSRMLGHENPQVTLKTYAELFDDDLDKVSSALDIARGETVSKPSPKRVHQLQKEAGKCDSSSTYVLRNLAVAEGFEPYSATWSAG